jgi:hypothetical protein
LDGLSTDVPLLNEIFCLLPHHEIAATGDSFNRKYGVNLKDRLQAKLSGTKNHLQLLIKLLHNGRAEDQTVDETLAVEQARTLSTIFTKKSLLGNLTDDATTELTDFILTLSYSQAQAVKVSLSPHLYLTTLFSVRRNNSRFKIQRSPRWRHSSPSEPVADFNRLSIFSSPIRPKSMPARLWRHALAAWMNRSGESSEVRLGCFALYSLFAGHNVSYVDEIAVVYQKNFSADMRMVEFQTLPL